MPARIAGTTVLTALRLGRSVEAVELNPDYRDMAVARVIDDAPLFNSASFVSEEGEEL